jgi:hypothetical protein
MNKFLVVLTTIFGFQFLIIGLMWIVSPYNAAATFGIFSLSEGIGLSSQLGDTGSYFLSLGIMMIAAVYTQKSIWFYAPSIMLSITAVYRILSWLLHDAAFATQFIAAEIFIVLLLVYTSKRISKN